jgi:pilus assembly protein CpaD
MHKKEFAIAGRRTTAPRAVRALLIATLAATAAGCATPSLDATGSIPAVPTDYRQRHPIAIKERDRTLELFVGAGRGGLNPAQRAEVLAFAQTWRRESTGGVTIDRPVGVPNERAATDTLRETLAILVGAGIPNHGIGIRPYRPTAHKLGTLRLRYPNMAAVAGPCGLWPEDLGVTYDTKHFDNQPYYNLGCASQRNLASMVANPADLVQPRAETPPYRGKRTFGMDKWRKGESPATISPDQNKGAISDLGK